MSTSVSDVDFFCCRVLALVTQVGTRVSDGIHASTEESVSALTMDRYASAGMGTTREPSVKEVSGRDTFPLDKRAGSICFTSSCI